jgi:hypothetical protein
MGGIGGKMIGNFCDVCGFVTPTGGAGAFMFSSGSANITADGLIFTGNNAQNSSATEVGYCAAIQDEQATGTNTYENFIIANNTCTGGPGAGGMANGIRFYHSSTDALTVTNVVYSGNQINASTVTTPCQYNQSGSGSISGGPNWVNNSCFPANLTCRAANVTVGSGWGTGASAGTFFGNSAACSFIVSSGS